MLFNKIKLIIFYCCLIAQIQSAKAEDGYELWLRYAPITDTKLLSEYQSQIKSIAIFGNSPTIEAATEELNRGLTGLFKKKYPPQYLRLISPHFESVYSKNTSNQ
jgi:alpha-glucuronidase